MRKKLCVLMVEDSEDDAELLLRELRKSWGYEPLSERVDTREAMSDALKRQSWDVVTCDYSMPHFNSFQVLKLLHSDGLDIPCIIVSGKIGEETAVKLMKAGANDYVMKGNLDRLAPAIAREIGDKETRHARKLAEQALLLKNYVFDESIAANSIANADGVITEANAAFCKMWGYPDKDEAVGKPLTHFFNNPDDAIAVLAAIKKSGKWVGEFIAKRKDGSIFTAYGMATDLKDENGKIIGYQSSVIDVTEQKKAEEEIKSLAKFPEENPNPVGRTDYDGKLLYCNHNCNKKFKDKNFTCNNINPKLLDTIKKVAAENSYKPENVEIVMNDRTFLFTVVPVKGQNYINFYGKDITERKLIEESLKASYTKTAKVLEETIKTLATIVEIRDPYTSGHQQRVTQIAALIAKELGLEEDRVSAISTAATVHDIGKINIAASILSKPGKINELEFEMIKTHSETGYDILKNIDFSWPVANTVLQHHERINGSGYPKGLKGDDIMLEAKIIAVADVVEAMSSHRPYRPSLGIDQALKEIEKNKAILYDSGVVDACIKIIRQDKFEF